MNWILPALLLLGLLLLAWLILLVKAKRHKEDFPYQPVRALFSPAERSFLGVLDQAVGGRYRVFGKVRVADVATVKPSKDNRAWQRAFNRISAKHFDFILCDNQDLSVRCAIELDDQSHRAAQRQQRDGFIDSLCQTIKLPLVRIPARQAYSVNEIRQTLSSALGVPFEPAESVPAAKQPVAPPPQQPLRPVRLEESARPPTSTPPVNSPQQPSRPARLEEPTCPYCDSPMIRRTSRSGKNAGKSFWGCSQYPGCRGIVVVDD